MSIDTTPSPFSPKLKIYLFLGGALTLAITLVGILLLPLWCIFGFWWADRYYNSLKLELTDRTVVIKKGIWFRKEMTIPLDKIQDISIKEGPLLKAFGLLNLTLETAGQRNANMGTSDADLTGLLDARGMRDRILALRDAQMAPSRSLDAPSPSSAQDSSQDLLRDIRDALVRIESKLG